MPQLPQWGRQFSRALAQPPTQTGIFIKKGYIGQKAKSQDNRWPHSQPCLLFTEVTVTWVSMAPSSVYDWGNLNDVYTCNRGRRASLPRRIVEQWHHSQPQAHTLNQSPVLRNRSRWIIVKFIMLIMIRRINFSLDMDLLFLRFWPLRAV